VNLLSLVEYAMELGNSPAAGDFEVLTLTEDITVDEESGTWTAVEVLGDI